MNWEKKTIQGLLLFYKPGASLSSVCKPDAMFPDLQFPFDVLWFVMAVLVFHDVLHVHVVEQYVFGQMTIAYFVLFVPRHRVFEVVYGGLVQAQFLDIVESRRRRHGRRLFKVVVVRHETIRSGLLKRKNQ